jgi:hypothetical protein
MNARHCEYTSDVVAWCEIEGGGYTADLQLWTSLCGPKPLSGSAEATFRARTLLELGAGVGRVCVPLRALGMDVWALEREQELLDEIARRARVAGIGEITPICADARSFTTAGPYVDLVIAPQTFVQMFEARSDRVAIMEGAARHMARPGESSFWMTYHPDLDQAWGDDEDAPPPPRVSELGGRTFEIQPLEACWHTHEEGRSLRFVWSRRIDGRESIARTSYAELSSAGLEQEASEAGLKLTDSVTLPGDGYFVDQVALGFTAAG